MKLIYDLILDNTPIIISSLALGTSIFALGWNIYRDVVLKPRLRVSFALCEIVGTPKHDTEFVLSGVNFGPGPITCKMIQLCDRSLWRILLKKKKHAVIIHAYNNPLSSKLPARVEVGDTINLMINYKYKCFPVENYTHIGISDTFGRVHWAPRRDVITARRSQHESDLKQGNKP